MLSENIRLYRMIVLQNRLELEGKGIRFRGRSTLSIVKSEFGLSGSRQKVQQEFTEIVSNYRQSLSSEQLDGGEQNRS